MAADGGATNPAGPRPEAVPAPVLNIANVLTVSRLALVPVFVIALFWEGGHDPLWRWLATAVFVLASVTDRVDGDLARKRGLVTDFGKLADPIADKALTGAALISLSLLGDLGWWATGIILGRELGITALRFWVIRHGVIPASRGGKVKTLLQAVAIGLYLIPVGGWLDLVRFAVLLAAVLATVYTGADYVARALRMRAVARSGAGAA
ncbi:CDP-diacylglycerol--glycerol-3-phosphate 3-phosphatidyltransferase [Saccharopolyspora sp. HNM0983]|uniref:CDP-diacylglycerol--glycerol-3-phosphate 3-phosphatidyltransferase n=1 Tax=Saccharopolyspora montiporae TaxID=2781240 RepID=A0A929B6T7_9PSEU|nr:CDP-diacylglycerol--glycerol-3-phosphate 3-phosphatidyltransferase [Saccharopolyspora sp. HNM0983]MBE9374282.1 CDP-diacylglycerol--glycerol-3-phosphate 3-phosphatidyltransferase [Saccharopolyspora sp. HNM0983]